MNQFLQWESLPIIIYHLETQVKTPHKNDKKMPKKGVGKASRGPNAFVN
jgi:hypothetical protein